MGSLQFARTEHALQRRIKPSKLRTCAKAVGMNFDLPTSCTTLCRLTTDTAEAMPIMALTFATCGAGAYLALYEYRKPVRWWRNLTYSERLCASKSVHWVAPRQHWRPMAPRESGAT